MNYLDLFSGIGGFALGAYNAGWRFDDHYFSEVDKYATKVYRQRFPGAIPLGDIREIDAKALADSNNKGLAQRKSKPGDNGEKCQTIIRSSSEWFITGGFPCQDISVAGKGEGIGGSRSGLWFEMWRIIRELRPRWVIAENVGAITFRGLADVVNSLAEIGYDCEWQDIRASDMGAPHRRERIWIVAYPHSRRLQAGNDGARRQKRTRIDRRCERPDVADSNKQHDDGSGHGAGQICREQREKAELPGCKDVADTDGKQKGRPTESWRERNQWPAEPPVGRVAHGIPRRVDRLKCLGNSIVPQIAELLFRQISISAEGQINGRT